LFIAKLFLYEYDLKVCLIAWKFVVVDCWSIAYEFLLVLTLKNNKKVNATVIIDCIGMYYVLCFDAGIISLIIEIAVADDGRMWCPTIAMKNSYTQYKVYRKLLKLQ
jgi:hypothetical protein